jgi:membrane protein implicated in regulation of membrane protease activity
MTALAAVLYLGSGLALSWIAGFQSVWNEAQHPQWAWLAASLGFVALAFVGYYFGYRGVGRVEGGPTTSASSIASP